MTLQLPIEKLSIGTIFQFGGTTYQLSGCTWGHPTFNNPECTEAIFGKPCRLCHPKLGGEFQTEVRVWFTEATVVTITS